MASSSSCVVTNRSKLRSLFELTRLHRFPLGTSFTLFPSVWGLTMGAYAINSPAEKLLIHTFLFLMGGTALHAAACVLNDLCDIEFDRQVERCKTRPLASGDVTVPEAWMLIAVLMIPPLLILQMADQTVFILGMICIFPLHSLYPLMKRWIWWPQAWLGLALNWPFLVGWASMTGELDQAAGVFFFGTFCWTIVYDTIYACQDRKDDVKAGVKSTALLFGEAVRAILAGFAIVFVACIGYAGVANRQGSYYFFISVATTALFLAYQLYGWKIDSPADCALRFKQNSDFGYVIWLGLTADYLTKNAEILV